MLGCTFDEAGKAARGRGTGQNSEKGRMILREAFPEREADQASEHERATSLER